MPWCQCGECTRDRKEYRATEDGAVAMGDRRRPWREMKWKDLKNNNKNKLF